MAQAVTRPGSHPGIRIALLISLLVASIALGFAIPNATADTLVTSEATSIIARVPNPQGSGSPLAVIRDGDKPAAGTTQTYRQYDSWDGANSASEDWVGYTFSGTRTFTRVVFQEGMHFWDGGWFISLTVHVRKNGIWTNVEGLSISPGYGGNDGVGFETYTMSFTPMTGDAIRIIGKPGGCAAFISVAELEVYATQRSGSPAPAAPLPPPFIQTGWVIASREFHRQDVLHGDEWQRRLSRNREPALPDGPQGRNGPTARGHSVCQAGHVR